MGCGIQNKPAIYGKIWKYVDWIEKTISDAKPPTGDCGKRPLPKETSKVKFFNFLLFLSHLIQISASFSQTFRERGYGLLINDTNTADVNSSMMFNVDSIHIRRSVSFKNGPQNKTFDLDIEGIVEVE